MPDCLCAAGCTLTRLGRPELLVRFDILSKVSDRSEFLRRKRGKIQPKRFSATLDDRRGIPLDTRNSFVPVYWISFLAQVGRVYLCYTLRMAFEFQGGIARSRGRIRRRIGPSNTFLVSIGAAGGRQGGGKTEREREAERERRKGTRDGHIGIFN